MQPIERPSTASWAARLLGVAVFALVLFQLYQSTKVSVTPRGTPAREALQLLHISVGLLLLGLVTARLMVWLREPALERPKTVPPTADRFARTLCLLGYLTVLAFGLTGPFFAWSEGHAASFFGLFTLPALIEPSYAAQVRLGYMHSAIGFWIFYFFSVCILTAIYQRVRYRAPLLRLLPGFAWSNAATVSATREPPANEYGRWGGVASNVALICVAAWSAREPYRVFGVSPFPVAADQALVQAGPPPSVDPYAAATAAPALSEASRKDFMWCRFCHSFEAGGPHAVGPNLHRVFGRRAASAPGFHYSASWVKAGEGGLVWDDATVNELIADPAKFLGGDHRMRYEPITDPEERAQIVAALKHATR